jgi:hypothetical protein
MATGRSDGQYQACYWRDAAAIGGDPDATEYSDLLMELKARIDRALRRREFGYAAIFRWDGAEWELVEEFEPRAR